MSDNIFLYIVNAILIMLLIPILGYCINIIVNSMLKILANINHKFALCIANKITFIGTVHHELSHALFAFCTGAQIKKIDLFHPDGNTLGKVTIHTRGGRILRSIQLSVSAIAPMILGAITESALYNFICTHEIGLILKIVILYVMISILIHMTMSKQDLKNYFRGFPVCVLITFIILCITKFGII